MVRRSSRSNVKRYLFVKEDAVKVRSATSYFHTSGSFHLLLTQRNFTISHGEGRRRNSFQLEIGESLRERLDPRTAPLRVTSCESSSCIVTHCHLMKMSFSTFCVETLTWFMTIEFSNVKRGNEAIFPLYRVL